MDRELRELAREVNRKRPLTPYRQGDLDGLCGLYAVVNAMRLSTKSQRVHRSIWRDIFAELVILADLHVGISHALTCGIDRTSLIAILEGATRALAERHGLQLFVRRPLRRLSKLSLGDTLGEFNRLLSEPNAALLFSLAGAMDHWTVLHSLYRDRLVLWDSAGLHWISASNCRMGNEPVARAGEYVLRRGDVMLLSVFSQT